MTAKFGILIETNKYAGNFEREMCAHLTGQVGECKVGAKFVDETVSDFFEDIIGNEADDRGCYRPVTLGSNIDVGTNQGVVIFFEKEPSQLHLDMIKERLQTFTYTEGLEIKNVELIEFNRTISRKNI